MKRTHKYKILVLTILFILLISGIFIWRSGAIHSIAVEQFAQIILVDASVLKEWQRSSGLGQNMEKGSRGDHVEMLQRMLSQDTEIYPEKEITGYYGKLTKNAVARFQEEEGLEETGIVDEMTRERLNQVFSDLLCPKDGSDHNDMTLARVHKDSLVPVDYVPSELIELSEEVSSSGVVCLTAEVAEHLKEMFQAAEEDGVMLSITSGFRKPLIQLHLFRYWLRIEGHKALREVAIPGASEHQLGTAVDLTDSSIEYRAVDKSFAESDGGLWMKDNAYKFGFTLTLPEGLEKETGFNYEPWHWRYVGKDIAKKLYKKEEYFIELDERDF